MNISPYDYIGLPVRSLKVFLESRSRQGEYSQIKEKDGRLIVEYKGHQVRLACDTKNPQMRLTVADIFVDEIYGDLQVNGKVVIDIGASIGDTAVYFVLNGARHVYAFEPDKQRMQLLKQNLRENKIESKVTVIGRKYKGGDIEKIIGQQDAKGGIALKVDCEGGEYELLNEKKEALRKISSVNIEYHYGYRNLVDHLEGIFSITYTRPFYFPAHKMYVGYIRGIKKA